MGEPNTRRGFLVVAAASTLVGACRKEGRTEAQPPPPPTSAPETPPEEGVSAVEDLMREHGVIRRVLVVYRVAAARMHGKASAVPADLLQKAARLMRTFGEDYHERQLEEAHLFPVVRRGGGEPGALIDTLVGQHNRGREITDYVITTAQRGLGRSADAGNVARALEGFATMYETHAAQEDTVIFPAYKRLLSPAQLEEAGDLFEDIEHRTFGKDGFEDAVDQVSSIEQRLGIDVVGMTAPPPPRG
jgi:hemerythrin-like domain-containing protein